MELAKTFLAVGLSVIDGEDGVWFWLTHKANNMLNELSIKTLQIFTPRHAT